MKLFPTWLLPSMLLALLFSCGGQTGSRQKAGALTLETSSGPESDTISIDFVRRFEDTGELYVPLYLQPELGTDAYTSLARSGDSVIRSNDEYRRTRIPIAIAQKALDLRGLRNIEVYDENHTSLGTATLQRIEYFEDLIESSFIAVYAASHTNLEPYYCATSTPLLSSKSGFKITQVSAAEIKFHDSSKYETLQTYHLTPAMKDFVVASTDTLGLLFEVRNDELVEIYRSENAENLIKFFPLAMEKNGYPLILIEAGKPETDMLWSALLVFNGIRYETCPGNRVGVAGNP